MHTFTQTGSLSTVRPPITDTHKHTQKQQNRSKGILSQLRDITMAEMDILTAMYCGVKAGANLVRNWMLLLFAND